MTNKSPASQNLPIVLDASRAAIEAESQLADRLDEKARGQATLAGAWFTITQAIVAATVIGAHLEKGWIYGLAVGLALQAVCLVRLFSASARVWTLRTERGVGVPSLRAMQADQNADPVAFISKAVDLNAEILGAARQANEERADAFDDGKGNESYTSAMFWWWRVLSVGLVEIAVALLAQAH
jgi:hypothetical protein